MKVLLAICSNSYENTTLEILKPLELLTRMKSAFFVKSRLVFNIFYCFCIFINKHWAIPEKKTVREIDDIKFPGVLKK